MATPKRHAANVLNAQKSTGPRTAAGKAKSASNARRHGLSARGAADLGAEDFLADLFADWPEDFGWDNFRILEALASTQARLARAGELEALAVEEIADAAPTLGLQEVERDRRRTTARSCMGRALAAGSCPVGPYGAEDFRLIAEVFRAAGRSEPECAQALERLRKLSRHTRDAEALRRKLVKALAAAARDTAPELDLTTSARYTEDVGVTRPLGTRVLTAALLALLAIPATAAEVKRLDILDARKAGSQAKICCLSGADTAPDGALLIVSDKSTLFEAQLDAGAGTLKLIKSTPLTLSNGAPVPGGRADAEGVAIGSSGATHISFEGQHRVALYDGARGVSSAPAPSKLNLPENGGLEALAVDAAGALWAIPETATGTDFPLLRYAAGQWKTVDTLPASGGYLPVGADFDAAGALYVLERRFSFFQFRSRVRRLTLGAGGIATTGRVWESETGAYDNLEALVVIEGAGQTKALLMISDDNAMPFQETQALLLALSE